MGKASRSKKEKADMNNIEPQGNIQKVLIIGLVAAVVLFGISLGYNLRVSSLNKSLSSKVDDQEEVLSLKELIPAGAPKEVKEAYTFAQENIAVVKKIKCYCGCQSQGSAGHNSLSDCFVDKIKDSGQIIYSDHARSCQVCVGEAIDTKQWLSEGKSYDEISKSIDAKYDRSPQ